MVRCGLQVLVEERRPLVSGRRVGLLCHPASVDGRLVHATTRLREAGAQIECLLAPEHGVGGEAQDMVAVPGCRDDALGVPVHTLYGTTEESLRPRAEWLAGLDALLIDLQDIGSRYYTFVWTMLHAMEVCAAVGVQVVVLDRPNPVDGCTIEGPGIADGYRSFVGRHDVPVRHALTIGELARLLVSELRLDVALEVVPMRGWRRAMSFAETGLPWVLPSPNMPTPDTAIVYPGGCLLEGTNVSEGRGTTRPFEIVGAPWIDGPALVRALDTEDLPGAAFRPLCFSPTFHKHAGQTCGGIQLHVVDRARFRPLLVGVALIACIRRLWPRHFAYREEPYEFVTDRPAIDLLAGGPWLREGLARGAGVAELRSHWRAAEQAFAARRRPFLIYPEQV